MNQPTHVRVGTLGFLNELTLPSSEVISSPVPEQFNISSCVLITSWISFMRSTFLVTKRTIDEDSSWEKGLNHQRLTFALDIPNRASYSELHNCPSRTVLLTACRKHFIFERTVRFLVLDRAGG